MCFLQDRKILKNVNREAAIYRGYPSAIFFGGLTYYSLRSVSKISSAGRLGCAIFAGRLFMHTFFKSFFDMI